jgi:hypothetical protein
MGRHDEAIQAFNSMLSTLERFADPPTQREHFCYCPQTPTDSRLRSGHSAPTMAIQRIDPRMQTLRHYPPRRNLDYRLTIDSIMTTIQDVDPRRTTDILNMLRAERDEMVRERGALPSADQSDRPEQQPSAVNEAPGTNFAASNERLHEQMTTERDQKLHELLTELARQNREDDKQAPELMKKVLRLAEQQLILRPQQDEQSNVPGKSRPELSGILAC